VVSPIPDVAEKAAALAAPSSTTLAPPASTPPASTPPAPSKTPAQRAEEAPGQKVTIEPIELSPDLAAQHLDRSEGVISKRVIMNVQNALGVKPDGDPGLADSGSK